MFFHPNKTLSHTVMFELNCQYLCWFSTSNNTDYTDYTDYVQYSPTMFVTILHMFAMATLCPRWFSPISLAQPLSTLLSLRAAAPSSRSVGRARSASPHSNPTHTEQHKTTKRALTTRALTQTICSRAFELSCRIELCFSVSVCAWR